MGNKSTTDTPDWEEPKFQFKFLCSWLNKRISAICCCFVAIYTSPHPGTLVTMYTIKTFSNAKCYYGNAAIITAFPHSSSVRKSKYESKTLISI